MYLQQVSWILPCKFVFELDYSNLSLLLSELELRTRNHKTLMPIHLERNIEHVSTLASRAVLALEMVLIHVGLSLSPGIVSSITILVRTI